MSLRSIILKGRFYFAAEIAERLEKAALQSQRVFQRPDLVLIRAQSVWDDLVPAQGFGLADPDRWTRVCAFEQIPRPRPPYGLVWLEAMAGGIHQRVGALVQRIDGAESIKEALSFGKMARAEMQQCLDEKPETGIFARFFHDENGCAGITGWAFCFFDQEFNYLSTLHAPCLPPEVHESASEDQKEEWFSQMTLRGSWVLHTFARMNCANTKLVEIPDGHKHHRRHHRPPSSVWHEIQVSAAPKIRYAGSAEPLDDGRQVRLHSVRGHYADYTKGRGLFGNPKLRKLFWIPEHQAGDKELGTVVSSYELVKG